MCLCNPNQLGQNIHDVGMTFNRQYGASRIGATVRAYICNGACIHMYEYMYTECMPYGHHGVIHAPPALFVDVLPQRWGMGQRLVFVSTHGF